MSLVLLLLACGGDDPTSPAPDTTQTPTTEAADTSDTATTTTTTPATPLPPEATDLDPTDGVLHVQLTAAETTDGFAYNGTVPGPTLRASVGDTLIAEVINDLPDPTTVHWHGVHVPWEMDGVTWMQDPIESGASKTYTFTLDRAGTFWYHPHFDTDRQVDLGLYGMLVVTDPSEPAPTEDQIWVFDTPGEFTDTTELDHDHGWTAWPVPWELNSRAAGELQVPAGEPVLARLLNASNAGYLSLSWPDMRVVGGQQGLLEALETPETLILGPGERAVVEWTLGTGERVVVQSLPYTAAGPSEIGEPVDIVTVVATGTADAHPGLAYDFGGAAPSADPSYTDLVYTFTGDVHTGEWEINGETYPDITVETVALGSTPVVEVRNLSPTEHPFHLHGTHFEVLSVDGSAPAHRTIADTVNLGVRQSLRVQLFADNPGDWMAHCHILPHAHSGMMTVLRVE